MKRAYIIGCGLLLAVLMIIFMFNKSSDNCHDTEIFPISLGIVNSYVVKGDNGIILVDTGEEGNEDKILSHIKTSGFKPEQVKLILITHGHIDHFGSAGRLRKLTNAKIAINENDKIYLTLGKYAPVVPVSVIGRLIKFFFIREDKVIPGVSPDITFGSTLDLKPYGVNGRVISTPGHTDGSVSVILDSGKSITGDLLMDYIGIDYAVFAVDKEELHKSVKKVISTRAKKIFVSHGNCYDTDEIQKIFGIR